MKQDAVRSGQTTRAPWVIRCFHLRSGGRAARLVRRRRQGRGQTVDDELDECVHLCDSFWMMASAHLSVQHTHRPRREKTGERVCDLDGWTSSSFQGRDRCVSSAASVGKGRLGFSAGVADYPTKRPCDRNHYPALCPCIQGPSAQTDP